MTSKPPLGALASLSLALLLPSLTTSIANAGLPTLVQAFATSFQAIQWVILAYLLVVTALVVSVGRLGDLVGKRRLLVGGILLFTAASGLSGAATDLWQLIAARAAQGLGAAVMLALSTAFVGELVPKEKAGSVMGLLGSTSALGTTLGPSLGGALTWAFGWPAMFLVNLPLGLLAACLASRYLPKDDQRPHGAAFTFDYGGTALLAVTLGVYALSMTVGRGQFGVRNLVLLTAALVGAGLFVVVEAKAKTPLLRLALFRDRAFRSGIVTNVLVSTVIMATLVVGPFYLAHALALTPVVVGLAISVGPLVAMLTGAPAGRVVDRFGPGRATASGLGGMLAGLLVLSFTHPASGLPGYVLPLALVTASYALFQAANNTAVMGNATPHQRGLVSGVLNLSRSLGLITGTSVMGAVFAAGAAASDIATAAPAAIGQGMRLTFLVSALLMVLALAIAGLKGSARIESSGSPNQ